MIYALFVVYENKLKGNSLFSFDNSKVTFVIFDNSTTKDCQKFNKEFCQNKHIVYISFGCNKGLSFAYNYVIQNYLTETDYILFLDDDTNISQEYLSLISHRIQASSSLVFSPININIKTRQIDSPKKMFFHFLLKSTMVEPKDKEVGLFNSINNGTLVAKKAFDITGLFDPDIFVYFVDSYLYFNLFLHNIKTEIIDYKNQCDFSIQTKDSKKIKKRIQLMKTDGYVFYRKIYQKLGHPKRWRIHYHTFFLKKSIECARVSGFLHFFSYLSSRKIK